MAPAVPETPDGVKAIRLGVLELARLKRLKISARNSSPRLSRNAISFSTEKSQVAIEPTIGRRRKKSEKRGETTPPFLSSRSGREWTSGFLRAIDSSAGLR